MSLTRNLSQRMRVLWGGPAADSGSTQIQAPLLASVQELPREDPEPSIPPSTSHGHLSIPLPFQATEAAQPEDPGQGVVEIFQSMQVEWGGNLVAEKNVRCCSISHSSSTLLL